MRDHTPITATEVNKPFAEQPPKYPQPEASAAAPLPHPPQAEPSLPPRRITAHGIAAQEMLATGEPMFAGISAHATHKE